MKCIIRHIILWPKDTTKTYRSIDLVTNKVNVLTGKSQTGKSALIAIIDYCLGSGKCTIPVGLIREKTEWFGVLLELEGTQVLLARREPGAQIQTGDMYMDERVAVDIPDQVRKNCTVEAVKNRLNQAAGLSTLDFSGGTGEASFQSRASFRDMAAFNFLPQHIVANPYTLFFKADTQEHQEKLRVVFPLVLGAITNESLSVRREVKELERILDRRRRELKATIAAANIWAGEMRSAYAQAREYGLLEDAPDPDDDWNTNRYATYLTRATANIDARVPILDTGATERAIVEMTNLKEQEEIIARSISFRRFHLLQMEQIDSASAAYRQALNNEEPRLSSVGWFADMLRPGREDCPICHSTSGNVNRQVNTLVAAAGEIRQASEAVVQARQVYDTEIADLRKELREDEERLNEIRKQTIALNETSAELRARRQTLENIYRFIGRTEQALTNYFGVQEDSELQQAIKGLEFHLAQLKELIDPQKERNLERDSLDRISRLITPYAQAIGVEHPEAPVHLDIANLTIRVALSSQRRDFLWEIGSGANWMGYHIATMLALHQYFWSQSSCPVPGFLIIDQPSQVFFPESWPVKFEEPVKDRSLLNDPDIQAVRKIFEALALALKATEGKLQIFIIDHAGEMAWEGIDGVHLVDRWREEKALIPADW